MRIARLAEATTIVGRSREISEISRLLRDAFAGRPQILAIAGEAGIGKTALTKRTAEIAETSGFHVLRVELTESEQRRPYSLWTRLMNEAGAATDRRPPDILNSIIAFVRSLLAHSPTLLIFENIHLCDTEDLIPLEIVGSEIDSGRLMILLTYRSTAPATRGGPLDETLGALRHDGNLVNLSLCRFPPTLMRSFVHSYGIELAPEIIDSIYERSEGNPRVAGELVRLAASGRPIKDEALETSPIFLRAKDLVTVRAAMLPSRYRKALVSAAVLGLEFTVSRISLLVPGLTYKEAQSCMRAAADVGIIDETSGSGLRYRFRHSLFRAAVLQWVPAAERRELRSSLGRKLERYHAEDEQSRAEELYPLFLEGTDRDDQQKGIYYAIVAGEAALRRGTWARVRHIFEQLLWHYRKEMTSAQQAEASFGLATAYCRSGDCRAAVTYLRSAFEYYRSIDDEDRLIEVALMPGDIELGQTDHFTLVEEAIAFVRENHLRYGELLRSYVHGLYQARGRYEEAYHIVRDRLAKERGRGGSEVPEHLLADAAYLYARFSRYEEALKIGTKLLGRAVVERNLNLESHALSLLVQARYLQGYVKSAIRYSRRARETAARFTDTAVASATVASIARFSMRAGQWDEVRRETDRGLSVDPRSTLLLPIRAMTEYYLGEFASGDSYLDRLIEIVSEPELPCTLPHASTTLLIIHRMEMAGSSEYLTVAQSLLEKLLNAVDLPAIVIRARIARAVLSVRHGDLEQGRAAYEQLSSTPTYNLVREYRIQRTLGLVRYAGSEYERAAGHFLEAVASCRKYHDLPAMAWTHANYADLLADPNSFGSHADTQRAYHEALRLARKLRMAPLVERVESSLENLAARSARAPGLGKRLSPREREVLVLVSQGRTDREIAASLGLSIYTVSNHVRHVLLKTGASNRLEAARYAEDAGIL